MDGIIWLTKESYEHVLELIKNPPLPTNALRRLMRAREPGETWSKDGKTFLCCGFGLPSPTCDCNGCKWEYGKLDAPSLEEAMRDRSDESEEERLKRELPSRTGR
jgi:hypothetical protein